MRVPPNVQGKVSIYLFSVGIRVGGREESAEQVPCDAVEGMISSPTRKLAQLEALFVLVKFAV